MRIRKFSNELAITMYGFIPVQAQDHGQQSKTEIATKVAEILSKITLEKIFFLRNII
ncbi:hypothetical protein [Gillisia limnaea]|uniref:Uncharacterized protein n=1 Tax=Gillisia limnaea (strain DSM 15749 / LMG 21470 / R-8282) TaxID=865937 RepID=H2BVJ2_GILLR|nr:hypothetical protein [Gillisia limnaea]EHQ02900.1 hypothetical protein Gilli_2269 [Gillisia limnaea DSM 15749]